MGTNYRRHKTPGPSRKEVRYAKPSNSPSLELQQSLIQTMAKPPTHVVGIDEVGMGAAAGPFVAASAIFPIDYCPDIKDSKRYSKEAARKLALDKFQYNEDVTLNLWVGGVDHLNRYRGLKEAINSSLEDLVEEALSQYPDALVIVDGNYVPKSLKGSVIAIPKADNRVPAVAAASIYAKVSRDAYMSNLPYLAYDFHQNKGYLTKSHKEAIKLHGLCPEHRTFLNTKDLK